MSERESDSHPPCPACRTARLRSDRERELQLCGNCLEKVDAGPVIPALRPPLPCARCGHTQLVRAVVNDRNEVQTAPATVGHGFHVQTSVWAGHVQRLARTQAGHGALVAHVCRGCGYTELYTAGFAEIPIGPQYGTELIDAGPQGPEAGPFR